MFCYFFSNRRYCRTSANSRRQGLPCGLRYQILPDECFCLRKIRNRFNIRICMEEDFCFGVLSPPPQN